ncbi:MAG: hypothetical protein JWM11_1965 [Planctomycetaceae bacterium]|nr:hypothetical protein [Planctomycetaceae bacterium]
MPDSPSSVRDPMFHNIDVANVARPWKMQRATAPLSDEVGDKHS